MATIVASRVPVRLSNLLTGVCWTISPANARTQVRYGLLHCITKYFMAKHIEIAFIQSYIADHILRLTCGNRSKNTIKFRHPLLLRRLGPETTVVSCRCRRSRHVVAIGVSPFMLRRVLIGLIAKTDQKDIRSAVAISLATAWPRSWPRDRRAVWFATGGVTWPPVVWRNSVTVDAEQLDYAVSHQ
jgi:hypothetical protein